MLVFARLLTGWVATVVGVVFLLLLMFAATAHAQGSGVRVFTPDGIIRAGTQCRLSLYGLVRSGTCTVGRGYGSSSSYIEVGNVMFQIRRDPSDRRTADFYRVTDGKPQYVTEVYARGACWVGTGVSFCAR
jgi:hypothetical protein